MSNLSSLYRHECRRIEVDEKHRNYVLTFTALARCKPETDVKI